MTGARRTGEPDGSDAERRRFRRVVRGFAVGAAIGFPFAGLVAFGSFVGLALDRHFGTGPWLMVAGVVLGAFSAFLNMFRVLSHWQRTESPDETGGDGGVT